MHAIMLLTAIVAAGCAGQPSKPRSDGLSPTSATAAPSSTEPEGKRLALAQKMHLKMVNQNGEQVFCKSSMVTGSHIRTEMRCYTADEMDRLEEQTERDVDQLNRIQSLSTKPGLPSK
ncbi:MAG: hypothetical protein ABJD53_03060 [Gammaproteobacteria bacterium]